MLARRRTALLGGALALVTMLLVLLLALSAGLSDTIVRSATTLSAGHVNVSGWHKLTSRDAAPIVMDAQKIRAIVEAETPGLDYTIVRHRGWAKVVSEATSLNAGLVGINYAEEGRLMAQLQLAPTSEYKDGGDDTKVGDFSEIARPGTAILFAGQARRLEVGVGDVLTLSTETSDGQSNTGEVRVVAVAKDMGMLSNWSIFVPTQTILDIYQLKPDTAGAIMVYLKDIDRASETMDTLRDVFMRHGYGVMDHNPVPFFMKFESVAGEDWTGQKIDLTIWSDEVSFLQWVVTAVDTISFVLITVLLIIIGVGIMNTMWIAVRERTGEVGTLRAIGMSRRRVLLMFLLEALLLGFFATVVGAGLGAAIGLAVDAAAIHVPVAAVQAILMTDVLHLQVQLTDVLAAIAVFTVVTALSALAPALRAARLEPVTAIHHIG
ncbi:MAG: FtsX-like permease family protein [Deltaproteobacteria bacterium]|nr:FtsX-like permease family protein [Deltaproteobacteria bacterium]MCB9785701.1 FtsX-like permease family protein [Deltaproteobacteria bacterium]